MRLLIVTVTTKRVIAFTIIALCGVTGSAADVIVANGRVFTAAGAGVIERASIVVSGNRITQVTTEEVTASEVAVIDAEGKTVLPGLIDVHFHAFFDRRSTPAVFPTSDRAALQFIEDRLQPQLEAYLDQGFTSVLSPVDFWPLILGVRDRLAAGELRGPRLFAAGGVFTGPGTHNLCREDAWCTERLSVQIHNAAHARAGVRRYAKSGVDIIVYDGLHKGHSTLAPAVLTALIDEAHSRKLPVLLHGVNAADVDAFVDLGIDGLLTPPRITHDVDGSLLARAGRRKLPVAITIEELIEQPDIRDNILTLLEYGALPVFGPDLAGTGVTPPEIVAIVANALSDIGLSNEEVLLAATRYPAHAVLGRPELGTLQSGHVADILIVDGNPLTDLDALANVEVVIKGGKIVVDNRSH